MIMPNPIIRTVQITKTYQSGAEVAVHALRGIDLEVQAGEFVAVMGTSGSGKTTFMNMIGCLDKPTTGEYWLDGEAVSKMNSDELAHLRNRKIGFVFQSFNLLARTSALENVELPLLYNPTVSAADRRKRAVDALESVGLGKRIHHHPNQLSGGQQQRVAIARSLVNQPVVLLADEPTGNLDSRTSVEMMEIFQRLNRQGITVMVVTHEPDIAAYATRNVVFRDGRLERDIYIEHPRDATEELKKFPPDESYILPPVPAIS
jgi:putative ABC transport system ATP-binding protein